MYIIYISLMNFVPTSKRHTFASLLPSGITEYAKPIFKENQYYDGWKFTPSKIMEAVEDAEVKEVGQNGSGMMDVIRSIMGSGRGGALRLSGQGGGALSRVATGLQGSGNGGALRLSGQGLALPGAGSGSVGRMNPTIGGRMTRSGLKFREVLPDLLPGSELKKRILRRIGRPGRKTLPFGAFPLNPRRIIRLIVQKFIPMLAMKMRKGGIRQERKMGRGFKQDIAKRVRAVLAKQQRGGIAIGAILSGLASLLPVALDIGSSIFPAIKSLFSRRKQFGTGMIDSLVRVLGSDVFKFLKKAAGSLIEKMTGKGIFDVFKKLGKTFVKLFKKGKAIVKKVAPVAKKAFRFAKPIAKKAFKFARPIISKTEKGRQFIRKAEQAARFAKRGISIGKRVISERGKFVLPLIQRALEAKFGRKIPLDKIPALIRNPRVSRIANAVLRKAGIRQTASQLLSQLGLGRRRRRTKRRRRRRRR